jgi:hypothetical protein
MINTFATHLGLFGFLLVLIFSFECCLISEPVPQKTSLLFPLSRTSTEAITFPKTALTISDFPSFPLPQSGQFNFTTSPSLLDLSHLKTYKLQGQEVVKITDLPPDFPIPEKRYLLRGKTVVRLTDLR